MKADDAWVVGACTAVVAFYAVRRYDTPDTDRTTTTRSLFLASGAGYVLASLALFGLLSEVVLKPGVLQLFGIQEATKLLAQYAAAPVLAAVVLTTLLPQAPVIRTADAFLLAYFKKLGRIPSGVGQIADQLALDKLALTGSEVEAGRKWILGKREVTNDLAARLSTEPSDARGRFTALLTLHRGVESLGGDPLYKPYFRKNAEAWRRLQSGFYVFAAQSQAFFVLFDQLAPRAGDAASSAALKDARAYYTGIGEEVRTAEAEFLARALVAVEPSGAAVGRRLRRLGFAEEIACPNPPVGAFLFLGAMLVLALMGVVCLQPPPEGTLPAPLVALVLGATQTCAVLLAVLPKARWPFFRRGADGAMPYLGWLLAAAAAGAAGFAMDRGVTALAQRSWSAAWPSDAFPLSPNPFMAAGLALVIGVLCDVDLGLVRFRRVAEGMLAGGAMVVFIALCIGLLKLPPGMRASMPAPWFPLALAFGLGFVPGLFAPHLHRAALSDRQHPSGLTDAAVAQPA